MPPLSEDCKGLVKSFVLISTGHFVETKNVRIKSLMSELVKEKKIICHSIELLREMRKLPGLLALVLAWVLLLLQMW